MRRLVVTASLTAAVVAVAGMTNCLAAEKPKIPGSIKSKVAKAIEELVSGDIAVDDTNKREQVFVEIDKNLAKDAKNAALKTPEFWVESMRSGFFSGKTRKPGPKGKLVDNEKMQVQYADESVGEVPIVYQGPSLHDTKVGHTLVVTVLPKGTDASAWLEANWKANETASKSWVFAAVVLSDKFPLADQPFLLAHAFGHMMFKFNTDPNRWYVEGVGEACAAVQKAAAENMPDRLAGVILRNPTVAVTNANSGLFSTYVLDEGAAAEVGKVYSELSPEKNVVAPAGETAMADLAAWIDGNAGRALPASYDFVTATNEKRIIAPWTGSVWLVSPAKRGETMSFKVTYDMDANSVDLSGQNLGEFVVYMNDDLVDLDKPVTVTCNGEQLVSKQFERNLKGIFETADTFGEYGRVFTAEFRGFAPTEVAPAGDGGDAGDGAGDAAGDGDKKDGDSGE